MNNNIKRLVFLSLMVSQALVLSIVESWIPVPVPIPGVKLGLANIIILTVIIFFDFKAAIAVVLVRTVLGSIFGGGPIVLLFSLAGGILSSLSMYIFYKKLSHFISLIGVSIIGAVFHNIGQISMAALTIRELSVFYYLPILMISGIITGIFTGFCTHFFVNAIKNSGFMSKI